MDEDQLGEFERNEYLSRCEHCGLWEDHCQCVWVCALCLLLCTPTRYQPCQDGEARGFAGHSCVKVELAHERSPD
jgi:hypothetical protein